MTRKRKRLLIQVGVITLVFFMLIVAVLGTVIYVGSTAMYLNAKNEMIDRDLIRNRDSVLDLSAVSVLLDYWREHPENIRREITGEEREAGGNVYAIEEEITDEVFDKLSDAEKLVLASDSYLITAAGFDYESYEFNYDGIYLVDISEENCGYIYIRGDKDFVERSYSLGDRLDFDISRHHAVQKMRSGNYKQTEYEIVDDPGSDSYYIGYAPVAVNGEVKCAVCIIYDWTRFKKGLFENLTVMAVIGIGIMLAAVALLMHFLHITAIRPLMTIQRGVRGYIADKDSGKVEERMSGITSNNEFGDLADDISQLAREIDRYTDENIQLAEERQKVTAELDLATRIQRGSLPDVSELFAGRKEFDISASMTPAKEIGGDFYDLFYIDSDHLAVVIADVSGKGIPASLFMMSAMILISDRALMGGTPSEILEFVNTRICERNKLELFVTVWFGILEISTGRLSCANAGHEYPMLNRGKGFELYKDKHGFVLGGMAGMTFKSYEMQLRKGDCIFVYTDGVPEATNPDNELFGTQRAVDALNMAPDASTDDLIKNVAGAVSDFAHGSPQADDMTMVCIKYYGKDGKEE